MGSDADIPVQYYACATAVNNSPDGCTSISSELEELDTDWQGLRDKVRTEIVGIIDKIYDDEELSDLQLGIIRSTSIPLYKYLAATAAYYPRGAVNMGIVASDYTDLIAEDILLTSLSSVVEKSKQAIALLPGGMSETPRVVKFEKRVNMVLKGMSKLREANAKDVDLYFSMQARVQNYERAIMSRLSSGMVQSSMWVR